MGNTFKLGNYVNGIFQDSSNNIGIGAAPSGTYKFEVTGTTKVSGILTLGSTISNGTYTYTLPSATGTLALTSALGDYLPLTGGTLTGALSGTSALFSNNLEAGRLGGAVSVGDLFVDSANNSVYVGRQSSTSGDNSKFYVRNRVNTLTALSVDPGGNGAVDVVGTFSTTRGTNLATATGDVGIGNATPATKLDVTGTIRPIAQTDPTSGVGMELFYRAADTSSYIQSYDRTNGAWKDVRIYGNTLYFGSQGTNNLTIASTGAATFNAGTQNVAMQVTSNNSNGTILGLVNTNGGPYSWGLNAYSNGTLFFQYGTLGAGSNPFYVTSAGAATFSSSVTATKFNIGADEGYALNVNGGNAYGAFIKVTTTAVNIPLVISSTATTGDNNLISFDTDAGVNRGTIKYNRAAGLVAYNTTSDYRLKSEILDFNALEIINNLKPKEFRIRNAESKAIGFIAHELQEYLPQAVSGEKDAIDEKGNPIYQGVDYSQLTALLTKAIQELKAEIEELRQIVATKYKN